MHVNIVIVCIMYVIVVTQGRVHCLICMHTDISDNAQFPVLQIISYTSGEAAVFIC